MKRALRWLRITDENDEFSLTHAFLYVSVVLFAVFHEAVTAATAAAAVANYGAAKKLLPFLKDQAARTATEADAAREHEVRLAEKSADTKNLEAHVEGLARVVEKLATPERVETVKRMTGMDPTASMPQRPRPTRL